MGVDTGRALHTVIMRTDLGDDGSTAESVIHLGVCHEFAKLDELIGVRAGDPEDSSGAG